MIPSHLHPIHCVAPAHRKSTRLRRHGTSVWAHEVLALIACVGALNGQCSPEAHTPILPAAVPAICLEEQGRGEGKAERLGRLQVDDQLKGHGLFDG